MRFRPFDEVMDELGFPQEPGVPEGHIPLDDGTSVDVLTESIRERLERAHKLLKSCRDDLVRAHRPGVQECRDVMSAIYAVKVAIR